MNLTYLDESGALNEAMSDVFAATIDWLFGGASESDTWKIGEAVYTPGSTSDALRYMDNPTLDGQSCDYYPKRYIGTEDYGGKHDCMLCCCR